MNMDYTLWPNPDGNLGNLKVQIPDGVTTQWPDGDALVNNFIYKDGKLVGFVDTKALIENESKSTVMPYDFVDITVDKRLETIMTFEKGERCKYFNINYEVMLPEGYKRLQYLESTGTQYIDTGIKLSSESEVGCEYLINQNETVNAIFGARDDYNLNNYCLYSPNSSGKIVFAYGVNGKIEAYDFPSVNQKYVASTFNGILTINGRSTNQIKSEEFVTAYSCFLFAVNTKGSGGVTRKLQGRIYSFSISRAGEMQVNYVPALGPTGAPCMYDIMSGEPFYSETADDFIYPNMEQQASTYSLRNRMYAKMTKHGIQRLYHVPENYSRTTEDYASEYGFKELVTSPMPTEGHWIPEWTETDTQLICNWVEADVQEI